MMSFTHKYPSLLLSYTAVENSIALYINLLFKVTPVQEDRLFFILLFICFMGLIMIVILSHLCPCTLFGRSLAGPMESPDWDMGIL